MAGGRLLVARLLISLPTLLGISILAFAVSGLAPGDPAAVMLQRQTGEQPSEAAVAALRQALRLDDPLIVRYGRWLARAAAGDLGRSYRTGEDVTALLIGRGAQTAVLAVVAISLGMLVGVPGGVFAAAHAGSARDWLVRIGVLVGESWPSYVLAYVLMIIGGVWLGWLPIAGGDSWKHAVLPSTTLAVGLVASVVRLTRVGVLDELMHTHVQAARAKGVGPVALLVRHALRVGGLLLLAFVGGRIAQLLGGAVVVETVFAWPGLGQALVTAVFDRDYPVIQAFVLYGGVTVMVVNLGADLLLTWLDPRVRMRA